MILLKNINFQLTLITAIIVFSTSCYSMKSFSILQEKKDSIAYFSQGNDSILEKSYQASLKMYKEKKYVEALKKTLLAFELSKNINNYKFAYKTSILIADIYDKTNNLNKSLSNYRQSLDYLSLYNSLSFEANKKNNDISFAKVYLRLGSTYQKKYRNKIYNPKENSEYEISAIRDSAIFFYNELEKIPSLNEDITKFKAISYYNLSSIYQIDSLFPIAKKFAIKAIEIHKKRNDKINQARAQNNLGSVYLSQGDFNTAKKIYSDGINLINNDNSPMAIKHKASLYYNLAWAMRNLKDYKAYDFQERYYEIEDNLRDENIQQLVKKIEANHNENLKQQEINLVNAQKELLKAEHDKTNLYLGLLTLLIAVAFGFVIYNYKLRQKNLKLKLSESNLLQQQSIEKLKSEAQIKILNATIDGKESERKLIAEILHDNVSALLSSANMHLSATKKQFNGSTPLEVEKTRAIILEASQKVRDLSHNLVSSILLKFGLEYAFKDVAKKYSNSQLHFDVEAKNISRYNQEFEIKIFNVVQELINNIIKHSKANYAKIALTEEKNQLTILVKDDGVGFTPSSSSIKDGIGLNQIEARIHVMNGKIKINSQLNKGTEIIITVPIQQQKKQVKLTSVS